MEYKHEILDRATGHLIEVSVGDWITVTELGQRYGIGEKKTRAVLHHIGLLAPEEGRYRLTRCAVERGLGMRHDRPRKSKYPFDVISPKGQRLIEQVWSEAYDDYEAERRGDAQIAEALSALDAIRRCRRSMTTQEEVCWVLDHYPRLTLQQVASTVEVDRALVSRYAKRRAADRGYWERWKRLYGDDTRATEVPRPLQVYMEASEKVSVPS